ncbi:hypothetical protein [Pseudomonas helleri]|uniref:hypothetical protein n=1 Tax=Pseudomonas helleri TaxID=1608996 RepID=UPI003A10261D
MTDLNGGALFNAEFGVRHRGSIVPERSGVALSFCRRHPKRTNVGARKRAHKHFADRIVEDVDNASKIIIEAYEASKSGLLAEQERKIKEAQLSQRELELENREYEIKQEKADLVLKKAKFGFLLKAFIDLKSSLKKWVESVKTDSYLDKLASRKDVEEKANRIINSDKSDNDDVVLVNDLISSEVENLQKNGFNVNRNEFSTNTKIKI